MNAPEELEVEVNGEGRCVPAGSSVADLLRALGLGKGPVAVERNREVVHRADHATTMLAAGDRLEIVTFFGGG
jgi:sulfur carrier protein